MQALHNVVLSGKSGFRTRFALRPKQRTCMLGDASREHSGASVKKSITGRTETKMNISIKETHYLSMCYNLGIRNRRGTLLAEL